MGKVSPMPFMETSVEFMGVHDLIARAKALRPMLRDQQAACEARGYPAEEVYQALAEAGFFKILRPLRFGGFQLTLKDFYKVVIEIARGCPSTGWWFALGAGHNAQIASYFSPEAQAEIFGAAENFHAPWSFAGQKVSLTPVDGGYRVSGKWMYCSGAPYATHFMGCVRLPVEPGSDAEPSVSVVVPRGQFTMLKDWGDLLGMKGSGSNSVVLDDVFVPAAMVYAVDLGQSMSGPTPGSKLHNDALYGGLFGAFAEGGLSAMAVGAAYAAVDEYESIIMTKTTPGTAVLRADNPDFQRTLGTAVALADSARAITLQGADQFLEGAQASVSGTHPFTPEQAARIDGMYHTAEKLAYEAVEALLRTSSSSALKDGQPLPRYFRDLITLRSRGHDQFEFRAAAIAKPRLKLATAA